MVKHQVEITPVRPGKEHRELIAAEDGINNILRVADGELLRIVRGKERPEY